MKLNKKQKRTATIASMAALLAVVLGMGGQTFAKYITTTPATAQATVAKWGVVVNANFSKLFGTDYSGNVRVDGTGTSVSATGTNNVVAPGTEGSTSISITGTPEVSTKVTFDVTGLDIGIYSATPVLGGATYAPVKWTVNDGSADVVSNKGIKEVKEYFDGLESTSTYTPGHTFTNSWTISWAWEFGDETNDANDTILGNEAAKTSGKDANIVTEFTFGLTITVAQVD